MTRVMFMAPQWVGILVGFVIGGLAEAWGIANPESIIRLTRWIDRLFITCVSLGGAFAVLFLYGLYWAGIGMHFSLKPLYFYGVGLGGVLFGVGLALSGYFPGSEWMALGEGRRDALFAIPAGLLGAASWTALYQTHAGQWLVNQANVGSVLITGRTIAHTSPLVLFLTAIPYALVLFAIAYFLPRFRKTQHSCLAAFVKGSCDEDNPHLHAIREDTAAYLLEGSIARKGGKAEKFAKALSSEPNVYSPILVAIAVLVGVAVAMGIMLHQIFGESTTYSWVVAVLMPYLLCRRTSTQSACSITSVGNHFPTSVLFWARFFRRFLLRKDLRHFEKSFLHHGVTASGMRTGSARSAFLLVAILCCLGQEWPGAVHLAIF